MAMQGRNDARPVGQVYVWCPIVCPTCKGESLTSIGIEAVTDSLGKATPLALVASCHGARWFASTREISRIRTHLADSLPFRHSTAL